MANAFIQLTGPTTYTLPDTGAISALILSFPIGMIDVSRYKSIAGVLRVYEFSAPAIGVGPWTCTLEGEECWPDMELAGEVFPDSAGALASSLVSALATQVRKSVRGAYADVQGPMLRMRLKFDSVTGATGGVVVMISAGLLCSEEKACCPPAPPA